MMLSKNSSVIDKLLPNNKNDDRNNMDDARGPNNVLYSFNANNVVEKASIGMES